MSMPKWERAFLIASIETHVENEKERQKEEERKRKQNNRRRR